MAKPILGERRAWCENGQNSSIEIIISIEISLKNILFKS